MKVQEAARVAAMTLGGSALAIALPVSAPASAQTRASQPRPAAAQAQQPAGQPAAQPARQLTFSRAERVALVPLDTAVRAQNWAAAQAALPAAQAAAEGNDARYFVARATWQIGNRTQNTQLEMQALDALVDMPGTTATERPLFLNRQAELAFNANDFAKAERAYQRVLTLTPNDPRVQQNLAVVRQRQGNSAGALEALLATLRTQEAAGQRPPEDSYRRALDVAYRARQRVPSVDLSQRLVRAYPTAANWQLAITIYRQLANVDAQTNLDALRLLRAARALGGDDYYPFAVALGQAGLPGETKAVIDEGIAARGLQASDSVIGGLLTTANRRITEDRTSLAREITQARSAANGRLARSVADALFGYGRYAEAVDLYRVALTKGGEDANLINTRLGAALALGGQRTEAETVFRSVTGPRADLAGFWLAWLASRPS